MNEQEKCCYHPPEDECLCECHTPLHFKVRIIENGRYGRFEAHGRASRNGQFWGFFVVCDTREEIPLRVQQQMEEWAKNFPYYQDLSWTFTDEDF